MVIACKIITIVKYHVAQTMVYIWIVRYVSGLCQSVLFGKYQHGPKSKGMFVFNVNTSRVSAISLGLQQMLCYIHTIYSYDTIIGLHSHFKWWSVRDMMFQIEQFVCKSLSNGTDMRNMCMCRHENSGLFFTRNYTQIKTVGENWK